MDIEVRGGSPAEDRAPRRPVWWRRRDSRALVLAVVVGIAIGFAVATVHDRRLARNTATTVSPSLSPPEPSPTAVPETAPPSADRMVDQVRVYNKTEPATVEVSDVVLMTLLRDNLNRLDTARSYPPGDYRLQVICLGEGDVWALFRIGDDESHVDIDCHGDHVLVTQLLLTAKATGRRAVTLVSDSATGLAVGYQILRTPSP
jgi:hypothetical protein